MPLFENNLSPYLTIVEATEPAAPSAGQQRLYIDSTTHLLKATNSSGTDRTIEGVPAGAVTTSGLTMNTARLLGRTTASAGAIEEMTVGSGLSLSAGSLTATGSAGNYVQLADSLLGSPAANFDFTSISGSYKHLVIIVSGSSAKTATSDTVGMIFNNDSGSNYDFLAFNEGTATSYGTGSGGMTESLAGTSIRIMDVSAASSSAGDVSAMEITIANYAATTLNKSAYSSGGVLFARSAGNIRVNRCFGSWRSTAAITRITLTPAGGNWITGSRATLYGLS